MTNPLLNMLAREQPESWVDYEFPVTGAPETVRAILANGEQREASTAEAGTLFPSMRWFKSLAVVCTPNSHDRTVPLLAEPMPLLKDLMISVDLDGPPDGKRVHPVALAPYDLHAQRLPALRTLFVDDTFIRMHTSICPNLQRLSLSTSETTSRRPFALSALLCLLPLCTQLLDLRLSRYIDVSGHQALPVLSLAPLQKLQFVKIEDEPHIVSQVLSHLIIPAHVAVVTTGFIRTNTRPHDAFRAIILPNKPRLSVLQHVNHLRVIEDPATGVCILCATNFNTHLTDEPGLAIELADLEEPTPGNGPMFRLNRNHSRDGTLFLAMVQSLELLQDAPVDELEFSGNLKAVPAGSWHSVFDRFPNVHHLEVADIPQAPPDSLQALFNALTGRSNVHPDRRAVCPRLDHFQLRCSIDDPGRLDAIIQCFEGRARNGCPILQCLNLELFASANWSRQRAESASEKLLCVADHVHLNVRGPTQSQCVTAGAAPLPEFRVVPLFVRPRVL
ncbi:hypothetical protein C8Q78DRAFT_539822 [Trametes maxima]|nr:hypothetical protein C8Q78DRAFT_539822 [Trametes maxima]